MHYPVQLCPLGSSVQRMCSLHSDMVCKASLLVEHHFMCVASPRWLVRYPCERDRKQLTIVKWSLSVASNHSISATCPQWTLRKGEFWEGETLRSWSSQTACWREPELKSPLSQSRKKCLVSSQLVSRRSLDLHSFKRMGVKTVKRIPDIHHFCVSDLLMHFCVCDGDTIWVNINCLPLQRSPTNPMNPTNGSGQAPPKLTK